MRYARIYPWRRTRRFRAPSNGPEAFFVAQFSAGYTTNMFGFDLRQGQGNCQISKSTGRIRTTGEDPDRREGVYCFAALVIGRPFDLRDPLRFGSRWN